MIKHKEKKERSLGEHLHLKGERCLSPKCAATRRPYRPGAHGKTQRRRTDSEFGRQIVEKQKFKVSYGITEKTLKQLFIKAAKSSTSTSAKLLELMERRLDNVVFRLGLASSRRMARQLIIHGHIFVNKRRVRSPGFEVKIKDIISFRAESSKMAFVSKMIESSKNYETPEWLSLNKEKLEGQVVGLPDDIESSFETNLLVESFSK